MVKYLLPILLCILHEPILSIDLNIYPKIIERNDNNKGEFQAYVSGMDEIIQMTLKNGNEIININFEKIIISDCQIFEFEKECKQSLIGCQWSSNKCLSATECDQLSSTVCEISTNTLKDKCEWDSNNKKCQIKKVEIKFCNECTMESDCKSNLLGCQWSSNKCLSATECDQLSSTACEKSIDALQNKCEWDSSNKKCKVKTVETKYCEDFTIESDCKSSLFGCQWSSNKCLSAIECVQLSLTVCEKSINSLRDICVWDIGNNLCKNKKLCEEFKNYTECLNNNLGCQWYYEKCINYFSCNQFGFPSCVDTSGKFKDKCEWVTFDFKSRNCILKRTSALNCNENINELDCIRSILGCYWYKDECIEAEQCFDLSSDFSVCLNNTGTLKDKCEWTTVDFKSRNCRGKQSSAKKCSDNLNYDDCTRSYQGCKWYRDVCIEVEHCSDLTDFSVCLNNTGSLKDKCDWFIESYSKSYCKDKYENKYIDNCKNITYEDCQKGLNGCYWISEKCILPTKCSDFNRTICQNIKSYSSFSKKCEWNESTKKCQRIADEYGSCSNKNDENDCSRSLLGCAWVNNKCVYAHQCSLLPLSVCENLLSNALLRSTCEWNEIPKKCQRKPDIYGLCKSNYNENDCSRSLLGCVWANNECVDAHQCSLLSSTACENILSNGILRSQCEWNKKTKQCQRKPDIYGLCKSNYNENDCSRSLLGCVWANNKCVDAHHCISLSSTACENILSNGILRSQCEWNKAEKKCQSKADLYGLCSDIIDKNDCSRSYLGCTWVNNECVIAHQCGELSSTACENILSNGILRSQCQWNKNDKICLQKKSIRLIRNLIEDEIITKYKCSFNFPNIGENKNYDLTLVDKKNNKASITLLLNTSDSGNKTSDDNNFRIFRSNGSFLKNNLFGSLIFILLLFMIKK